MVEDFGTGNENTETWGKEMKKSWLLVIGCLLFVGASMNSAQAQEKPDSTLFKQYSQDLLALQKQSEQLTRDYNEFAGKYYKQMEVLSAQAGIINYYLEQEKKKLKKNDK